MLLLSRLTYFYARRERVLLKSERLGCFVVLMFLASVSSASGISITVNNLTGTDVEDSNGKHTYSFSGANFSLTGTANYGAILGSAPPCNHSPVSPCAPGTTVYVNDFFSSGGTAEPEYGAGMSGTILVNGVSYTMLDPPVDLSIGAPIGGPNSPGSVYIGGYLQFSYDLILPNTQNWGSAVTLTVPMTVESLGICGYTATGTKIDGNPFCVSIPSTAGTATVTLTEGENGSLPGLVGWFWDGATYTVGVPEPKTWMLLGIGLIAFIAHKPAKRILRQR